MYISQNIFTLVITNVYKFFLYIYTYEDNPRFDTIFNYLLTYKMFVNLRF
ncbi:hypothetical protein Hanom_Chr03g00257231 [Helianthus anomalus]